MFILVACDLSNENILQNPEPFIRELKAHSWPRNQRNLRKSQKKGTAIIDPAAASNQKGKLADQQCKIIAGVSESGKIL